MRKFLCLLTTLCLLASIVMTTATDFSTASDGTSTSLGGPVNEKTQRFIRYNFSQADSPEELALLICDFAYENFTYDLDAMRFPQTADTNRFIFKNDFHGVCLDFATFTKTVFNIICRDKGWDHVGCHVALGNALASRDGHALNYISVVQPDGTVVIYEFDVTRDHSRVEKGLQPYELRFYYTAESPREVRSTIMDAFREIYHYQMRVLV